MTFERPPRAAALHALFVLIFGSILFCATSVPAKAEGQCPPGYFQTGGRDYIACAPMGPVSGSDEGPGDEEPSRPAAPPVEIQPSFMAAATHIDTSEYWVSRGHWTAEAANKRVMDACTADMGNGCTIADTVYGYGPLGVATDAMGLRWIKSGGEVPVGTSLFENVELRYKGLAEMCMERSFGCEYETYVLQGFVPKSADPSWGDVSHDMFPVKPIKRHNWALLAQPESASTSAQHKSWLISGKQNFEAAAEEVLEQCRTASGVTCTVTAFAANGVLVQFADSKGQSGWTSAVLSVPKKRQPPRKYRGPALPDRVTVEPRVAQHCPPDAKPCRVLAKYDTNTPRLQVIEELR